MITKKQAVLSRGGRVVHDRARRTMGARAGAEQLPVDFHRAMSTMIVWAALWRCFRARRLAGSGRDSALHPSRGRRRAASAPGSPQELTAAPKPTNLIREQNDPAALTTPVRRRHGGIAWASVRRFGSVSAAEPTGPAGAGSRRAIPLEEHRRPVAAGPDAVLGGACSTGVRPKLAPESVPHAAADVG
jgi:hypothetical protein